MSDEKEEFEGLVKKKKEEEGLGEMLSEIGSNSKRL